LTEMLICFNWKPCLSNENLCAISGKNFVNVFDTSARLATWFIRQFFWILGRNFRQPISPFPLQKTLYWLLGSSAQIGEVKQFYLWHKWTFVSTLTKKPKIAWLSLCPHIKWALYRLLHLSVFLDFWKKFPQPIANFFRQGMWPEVIVS